MGHGRAFIIVPRDIGEAVREYLANPKREGNIEFKLNGSPVTLGNSTTMNHLQGGYMAIVIPYNQKTQRLIQPEGHEGLSLGKVRDSVPAGYVIGVLSGESLSYILPKA